MPVTGYRSAGVALTVDLVNAVTTENGNPSTANIEDVLTRHRFAAHGLTPSQAGTLRRWALRLRPVFEAATTEQAIDQVNALLATARVQPHISDHGLGPHLHYGPPGAGLVKRVKAVTAMHMAELVCAYGITRSGACKDARCDRVYADTSSRNAARRYCSTRCANRANVAKFRARNSNPDSIHP